MKDVFIRLAKAIYTRTTNPSLRNIYYRVFCHIVRYKKLTISIDGIHFCLDLGESIDLCMFLGKFEPEMQLAIKKLCKPGYAILDIGANIGAHTFNMAKATGASGIVYAFEPTEYAFKKLSCNASLNPELNAQLFRIALSDSNAKNQTISFNSSWPTIGKPVAKYCQVDFIKLDDWITRNGVSKIDLVKLDVDGNEFSVINGARNALCQHKPIIMLEVWGPNFSDSSKNPFALLSEIGYSFHSIENDNKYKSLDDLQSAATKNGELADFSINVYARHDG